MEGEIKPAAAKNAVILPVGRSYHVYRCVDSTTIVEQGVVVATPLAITWGPAVPGALRIRRIIATFNSALLAKQLQIAIVFDDVSRRRNPHGME